MTRRGRVRGYGFSIRPHLRSGVPSGAWMVDVPAQKSENGRRRRPLFATKKEAEEYASRLARRSAVRAQVGGVRNAPAGITFGEASEQWWHEQEAAAKAGSKRRATLKTNAYQLRALLRFFEDLDLHAIDRLKVMEYQSARRESGKVTADTINSETARLKQVLKWAQGQNLCAGVPNFQSLPVRQRQPTLPSPEEIAAILDHLPNGPRLVVLLLFETGCRPSEIFGLRRQDVDFARAKIRLQPNDDRLLKNEYSERTVPISRELAEELRQLGSNGKMLLDGVKGISKKALSGALKSAVIKANIRRHGEPIELTPKVFRKVHGTLLAMRGVPEASLQTRFGHARGSRTLRKYYVWAEQYDQEQPIVTLPKLAPDKSVGR